MALTQAQLNAHIRTMLQEQLVREGTSMEGASVMFLLKAAAWHARTATADDLEAAKTVAQFVVETATCHALTASEAHYLRKHLAPAVGAADGVF